MILVVINTRKSSDESPNLQDITFFELHFHPRHQNWCGWYPAITTEPKQLEDFDMIRLSEQGLVPVSPSIENYWHHRQKWPSSQAARWLFSTKGRYEHPRNKMNPGWAVRQKDNTWLVSGWAWLPHHRDILYHYATIRSQMRELLSGRTHWLDALNLEGNVRNVQITIRSGPDAWNQAAKTVGGAND
ncbi:hypothetical protein QUF80_00850 [Desulfococcaceae bacterium HSG8]|nr:hypothetical protein [Desulfococcaceae bacterium HSG8]